MVSDNNPCAENFIASTISIEADELRLISNLTQPSIMLNFEASLCVITVRNQGATLKCVLIDK